MMQDPCKAQNDFGKCNDFSDFGPMVDKVLALPRHLLTIPTPPPKDGMTPTGNIELGPDGATFLEKEGPPDYYSPVYERALWLCSHDMRLSPVPKKAEDQYQGLCELRRWWLENTAKPKAENAALNPPVALPVEMPSWKPPDGYLNAKEIEDTHGVPRTTLQAWQQKDDVENGPLKGKLIKTPGRAHTLYYPEDWVIERIKTWGRKERKR